MHFHFIYSFTLSAAGKWSALGVGCPLDQCSHEAQIDLNFPAWCRTRTIFYLCFRFSVSKAAITRSIVVDDAIDATNDFYMRFTLKSCSFVVVGGAYGTQRMYLHMYAGLSGLRIIGTTNAYRVSSLECIHCSLEVCDIQYNLLSASKYSPLVAIYFPLHIYRDHLFGRLIRMSYKSHVIDTTQNKWLIHFIAIRDISWKLRLNCQT